MEERTRMRTDRGRGQRPSAALVGAAALVAIGFAPGCEFIFAVQETDSSIASTGPFCEAHTAATFCADFDHGMEDEWGSPQLSHGAVGIDSGNATSPPNSLSCSTKPLAAGEVAYAYILSAPLASKPSSVHFTFHTQVRKDGASDWLNIVTLQFGNVTYGITRQYKDGGDLNVLEDVPMNADEYAGGALVGAVFEVGVWSNFEVDVDFTARHLTVSKDGRIQADTTLVDGASSGPLVIMAGSPHEEGVASEWEWGLDSMLVEAK
jgi:hypothetical protein